VLVNLNGQMVPKEKAAVSVFDHGLLYGDGVFEGIRAYHGRVFRLRQHLERLRDSGRAILLQLPLSLEALEAEVLKTLAANKLSDGYVRLVVTRGEGDLGLSPEHCPQPFYFIIADHINLYPEKHYRDGLAIVTVPTRRNINEALSPRIKSLNYLNNILAKIEASQRGALEAIMLTQDGYVAECTGDNIFILRKGRLLTPPCYLGALEGVTRGVVMDLARKLKISCFEEPFTRYDVFTSEEAFLTGTAAEIVPVTKVDDRVLGNGKPGALTKKLIVAFKKLTQKDGPLIPKRG
jgi:branched-chain amino acid aminotransferase